MNGIFGSGNSLGGVFFSSRYARFSALVVWATISVATPVWAQRYKTIAPRINERQARSMRGTIDRAVKDRAGLGANADAVKEYFTKYYFPKMTGTTPESLAELGDMRKNLFRWYIRATQNAD